MKLKTAFSILLLSLPAMIAASSITTVSPVFNSSAIEELYKMLPESIRKQVSELPDETPELMLIDAGSICMNSKITIRFNQYNELSHLGLHVIGQEAADKHFASVFDYIERLLLRFCLESNNEPVFDLMQQEKIELFVNGNKIAAGYRDPVSSIIGFNQNTPFRIKLDNEAFRATWIVDNLNIIELVFPNNFIAITGKDKYELEKELIRDLKNLEEGHAFILSYAIDDLADYNEDILILKGQIYKGVSEISSDYFFYRSNLRKPVFDKDNFFESASNFFRNLIPTNVRFKLTQKLYGDQQESYMLDVNDFLAYFHQGYDMYFGWQNKEDDDLLASIFIHNKLFDYSHLLTIGFHKNDIFNENIILQATFYSYTPHGNNKKN